MAFGNKSPVPCRNYKYYTRGPLADGAFVDRQMRLAASLRNDLVRLERDRRSAVLKAAEARFPSLLTLRTGVDAAAAQLAAARRALREANSTNRRLVSDPALVAVARAAADEHRRLSAGLATARRTAYADVRLRRTLARLSREDQAAKKAVRKRYVEELGLFWSVGTAVLLGVKSSGPAPKFHSYDGSGWLYYQIQNPPTVEEVLDGHDNRIKLYPCPDRPVRQGRANPDATAADRRPNVEKRWVLELYVGRGTDAVPDLVAFREGTRPPAPGKDEKDVRRVARFELVWGRDLFPGSRIRGVHVCRDGFDRGPNRAWRVVFVLGHPAWPDKNLAEDGSVAVVTGFRRRDPNGLRGGYWVGSDGARGEILVPERVIEARDRVRLLESIRQQVFNVVMTEFAEWVTQNRTGFTAEFNERTSHVHQWKNPDRLATFVEWWRTRRQDGDADMFTRLAGRQDRTPDFSTPEVEGLHDIPEARLTGRLFRGWAQFDLLCRGSWAGTRDRMYNVRKATYVEALDRLKARYKYAYVADVDWGRLKRNAAPEDDEDPVNKTNYAIGAPASLRDLVMQRFQTTEVSAVNVVVTCHACGSRMDHPGAGVVVRCTKCERSWDRAYNAAQNVMARGEQLRTARV